MRRRASWLLLGLFSFFFYACGSNTPEKVDARDLNPFSPDALCAYHIGDPEAGQTIFSQPVIGGKGGCVTCHSTAPDITLSGPSLYGIATTAENRISGVIPANYIYVSIVDPNYSVVDGFSTDIMPNHYYEELTKEEITNLVSYLMTLTSE